MNGREIERQFGNGTSEATLYDALPLTFEQVEENNLRKNEIPIAKTEMKVFVGFTQI